MRLARSLRVRGEGGLPFLIIVLLIAGGIVWWLYSARREAEKTIHIFAAEVAKHVAVDYDERFLHIHLSPEGQAQFLRSWRDRLFDQLRALGVPAQPIELDGKPEFSSGFFDPHGIFRAHLKYPTTTADLDISISRGMTVWQIDSLNLIWIPPPPTPTPIPSPTASPSPTPAEKAKHRSKR